MPLIPAKSGQQSCPAQQWGGVESEDAPRVEVGENSERARLGRVTVTSAELEAFVALWPAVAAGCGVLVPNGTDALQGVA